MLFYFGLERVCRTTYILLDGIDPGNIVVGECVESGEHGRQASFLAFTSVGMIEYASSLNVRRLNRTPHSQDLASTVGIAPYF